MSKILIISDEELLSQLYTTNLEVYLDRKVINVNSLESALQCLSEHLDFDLIISLTSIKDINVIEGLQKKFRDENLIIPIIALGDSNHGQDDHSGIIGVNNYYNIQNIVRTSAKILGVTAKSMVSKIVPRYYPIDINFLVRLKRTPVDLFIEIKKEENQSEYIIFSSKEQQVDKLIKKVKQDGVSTLFVNANDRLTIVNTISLSICELLTLNKLTDAQEKVEILATSMDFVASNIVNSEISSEIIGLANSCTQVMADVTQEMPSLSALLKLFLTNKNGYLFTHAMLAAYVGSHIVKHIPWGGESQIEKINFVLFFHDIPLAPIFNKYPHLKGEEELLFNDLLSDHEKDIVLNHARMSAEMVYGLKKCPMGIDLLIKQHHGMGNGIGFAVEFRDDISPLSKVIILAEAFVEEFLKMKDSGVVPFTMADVIKNLHERFPKHTYRKIIDTLQSLRI